MVVVRAEIVFRFAYGLHGGFAMTQGRIRPTLPTDMDLWSGAGIAGQSAQLSAGGQCETIQAKERFALSMNCFAEATGKIVTDGQVFQTFPLIS